MRAIVYEKYGNPLDVLRLGEVVQPEVGEGEVLVKVRAASVNPYDWHWVTGLPYFSRVQFGLSKPKVSGPGADLAGVVESVGENATRFKVGDEVFGGVESCAFAEYVAVPEVAIASKPPGLEFEQAAAVPMAALTALQGLRDKGRIQAGQKVLINGASGGVGSFAVQLAAHFGVEVTGVCSSRNVELVRSLGAEHVIDYTTDDFTRAGASYDLILDMIGNHKPSACRRALTRKGVYVATYGLPERRWLGPLSQLLGMMLMAPFVSQSLVTLIQKPSADDLAFLAELITDGKVTPVIDRTYPLEDVPEAIRYIEEGHARGKVAITVSADTAS